jgi:hypothetical protein
MGSGATKKGNNKVEVVNKNIDINRENVHYIEDNIYYSIQRHEFKLSPSVLAAFEKMNNFSKDHELEPHVTKSKQTQTRKVTHH